MFVFSVNNEINVAMSFVAYATTHVFMCKDTSTIHANLDTTSRVKAETYLGLWLMKAHQGNAKRIMFATRVDDDQEQHNNRALAKSC